MKVWLTIIGIMLLMSISAVRAVPETNERYVVRELTDWNSVEELKAFLARDDTDTELILRIDSSGIIRLNEQCEDFALQLRDRALAQGKYLSVVPLSPYEYVKWYGEKVRTPYTYHMICMAIIGNECWYIEPTNDKCWFVVYLD